uniref:Protein phosphatase 1 regulatory subunit 22 n=1 Tax=Ascaris lumbricoides TaxID=6252 RepID=A0A0M3IT51_ASCLU
MLRELHISDQGLESLAQLSALNELTIIDASSNSISKLDGLSHMNNLEDLWLNDNEIADWNEVAKLGKMKSLNTIYLERNPIYKSDVSGYRRKVMLNMPSVKQIDATLCR